MRDQAVLYGSTITSGRVSRLEEINGRFEAEWGEGAVAAQTVLLATGVENRRPSIDETLHEEALARGYIRYCPVCDGYEVTDKNVAVIGTGERGVAEAAFLRSYTRHLTLIAPEGRHDLDDLARKKAASYGLTLIDGPAHVAAIIDQQIAIDANGQLLSFDSAYPALGSDTNSDLAVAIGGRHQRIRMRQGGRSPADVNPRPLRSGRRCHRP